VFVDTGEQLTQRLELVFAAIAAQIDSPGLSAAVYTEMTDIEDEKNGLFSYDRGTLKGDKARIQGAIARVVSPKARTPVLGTAEQNAVGSWRYVTTAPADTWMNANFDASSWSQGNAGFGAGAPPHSVVTTSWTSSDIWLRRNFQLTALPSHPLVHVYHDEDFEVYINGTLVRSGAGYAPFYVDVPFLPGTSPLKVGDNLIAVHCKQTDGGQYIDVGIVSEAD
jgi:hypothetical protein